MKQLIIIFIVFLPMTIQAGICTDNYYQQQAEYDDELALQISDCEYNPDCITAAQNSHTLNSAYNTLAWVGCCGSLGPLFC